MSSVIGELFQRRGGFKARNDVQQLLVDAALAQAVEGRVEILEQLVDVLVGALHRRQAAGVFGGQ